MRSQKQGHGHSMYSIPVLSKHTDILVEVEPGETLKISHGSVPSGNQSFRLRGVALLWVTSRKLKLD
jgi:hypothetical protein